MTGASIIIPVYNALEFARACIESVYEARTSVPFEIIVVDNGSYPEVGVWLAREQKQRQHFDPRASASPVVDGGVSEQFR
jgi:glycosyltransferase involved in cell wall biosynthesis